jgi:prepilin-type N-terminal cleavage/methylation domain-containing protein/prepilin-type processing-associated H-X9-DG protein
MFRRNGFSLIELLIVIGICALVIALILPAVQMAREASRRTQCRNNLKQIVTALNSYESNHQVFPAGSTLRTDFSAHAAVLPNLEKSALFNAINFHVPAGAADMSNNTARAAAVALFLCPSDRELPSFHTNAWTNYAANNGRGWDWFGPDGAFLINGRYLRASDFSAGMSKTIAFCEWVIAAPGEQDPIGNVYSTTTAATNADDFVEMCRNVNKLTTGGGKGKPWLWGSLGCSLYNHLLGPNENTCTNNMSVLDGAYSASSRHPGGIHAAHFDGSVSFVSESVELELWRSQGQRGF